MTWKKRALQSGSPICRLRARARRTSGNGSSALLSGVPTPDSSHHGSFNDPQKSLKRIQAKGQDKNSANLDDVANLFPPLAGWMTPKAMTGEYQYAGGDHEKPVLNLEGQAKLAGWNTPRASDNDQGPTARQGMIEEGSAWLGQGRGATTATEAQMAPVPAGWARPACRDWKNGDASQETMQKNTRPLTDLVTQLVPGIVPSPSPASTASTEGCRHGLKLNPAFSLWLMGYPPVWMTCGLASISNSTRSRIRKKAGRRCSEEQEIA
jgi:hypothetical protein